MVIMAISEFLLLDDIPIFTDHLGLRHLDLIATLLFVLQNLVLFLLDVLDFPQFDSFIIGTQNL